MVTLSSGNFIGNECLMIQSHYKYSCRAFNSPNTLKQSGESNNNKQMQP